MNMLGFDVEGVLFQLQSIKGPLKGGDILHYFAPWVF